ncbi:hypothetical protein CcaverHIS002_0405940 [Cutaneotrichosporon cavernicola]|nr:hypothetical protein CcaverHIS002_0405940 [Cutaneotrichosporon cavernicola]
MSSRGRGGKAKFHRHKKGSGPPKGGDGQGDFKGGAMTQYRTQPLPEMLCSPGIVVTAVQNKEMIAEREIIDALEAAADELYPGTGAGEEEEEEEGDIEDMLKKELEGAGGAQDASVASVPCVQARYLLYINVLPPLDPIALVRYIIERCERTARCSFRFIQRLTPVSATSHADMDGLRRIAAEALAGPFSGGPKKFAIQVATRNSNALERLQMIKAVAEEVNKLSPKHKVDLKNPDRTVMIELFKTALGISVVEDFEKYKKFNPAAVAREAAKASTGGRPPKRKAEDEPEEGQVATKADDVEQGEAVEDETAELGDDFVEEIQGGRVVKLRRQE